MSQRSVRNRFSVAAILRPSSLLASRVAGVLALILLTSAFSVAQPSELARQGSWTVSQADQGCESLPLFTVEGPGKLFEPSNSAALSSLINQLSSSLHRVCPQTREVVLVNGKIRKLVRLESQPQSPLSPLPSQAPSSAPPSPQQSLTPTNSATPSLETRPAPSLAHDSNSAPPPFPASSSLSSLSSAHGDEQKCDITFRWLDSGKISAPGNWNTQTTPAQMMAVFRDEPMAAVFGKPYDQFDNGERIELLQKVFAKCMGIQQLPRSVNVPRFGGIRIGGGHQLPPEYRQEFAQYYNLLQESFGGSPGPFEPANVIRYIARVRQQVAWANSSFSFASSATVSVESFQHLKDLDRSINSQLLMLRPEERDVLHRYLVQRQTNIAPGIIDSWLDSSKGEPKTTASADRLMSDHAQMSATFDALDAPTRASAQTKYEQLLDLDVRDELQSETAKLNTIPSTLDGARQFGRAESQFLGHYGKYSQTKPYSAAIDVFSQARSRIYSAALSDWQKHVVNLPLEEKQIASWQNDLNVLFGAAEDRSSPLYQEFKKPVDDKAAQLQAKIAADEQRRLAEAEKEAEKAAQQNAMASNNAEGKVGSSSGGAGNAKLSNTSGVLNSSSLAVPDSPNGEMLKNIFTGQFDKLDVDRSSPLFQSVGSGYIKGFSDHCRSFLPSDRIQLTTSVCDTDRVTTNGWGVETSRTCVSWTQVPIDEYADPGLYSALNSTPVQSAKSALGIALNVMSGNASLSDITGQINATVDAGSAAKNLTVANSCNGAAIRRFQENLRRFALGEDGISLNGTEKLGVALLPPASGQVYRDSNYRNLLEDMVRDQSDSWEINRFIRGSIGGVNVDSRDSVGRPKRISAQYQFKGFSGTQTGGVALDFVGGRPKCLFFSDQPSLCMTPAHSITSAYIDGKYR